jgi:hypothetical protein
MMAEVAEITPPELKFKFQLNKQLPAGITIYNPTNERLAFKVKTTTPRKYVVRPSSGVIEAKSPANVQVLMQAQKEVPPDFAQCKDKFLVQVKALQPGEEVNQDTFRAASGVKDTKIRVVLDGPQAPPSPVPEANEQDEDTLARGNSGAAGSNADGFASALTAASAGGDAAGQEARALRVQLERLMKERESLKSQLDKASRGISAGGSSTMNAAPMSLLPVLIVGLLAFLIGHYLNNIPVISKLLGKH